MPGDFTCTSAISGAATNTVVAGPGSLIAVPLLTSSASVGCWVGTTWLCAKGRLGAPVVTTVVGGLVEGVVGGLAGAGRTGAGAGGGVACACVCASLGRGVGAGMETGAGNLGSGSDVGLAFGELSCVRSAVGVVGGAVFAMGSVLFTGMSGVSEAVTIGARCGMAATVGGSDPISLAGGGTLGSTTGAAACTGSGVTAAGPPGAAGAAVMARTSCSARSASRRLRSSDTVSLAMCRLFFFAATGFALGFGSTWTGALVSSAWASTSVGLRAKASDAASAKTVPARRQTGVMLTDEAIVSVIATRWGSGCG